MHAASSADEQARLEELHRYRILDTLPEEAFERIVRHAAAHYQVPTALVSLVDEHRQWFKARLGFEPCETDRSLSFCSVAIEQEDVLVVQDTTLHPRFRSFANVTGDPNLRFYAGAPLVTPRGHRLGTLCILDTVPRDYTSADMQYLRELAEIVMSELELRATLEMREFESTLLACVDDAVIAFDTDLRLTYLNAAAFWLYGCDRDIIGRPARELFTYRWLRPEDEQAAWAAVDGQGVWRGEVCHVLRDGRELLLDVAIQALRDRSGTRIGFFGTLRDVTERRRSETLLELLRSVVVNANDAVIVTRGRPIDAPDGPEIIYVNDAFTRMTGYRADEVIGRTPRLLQGPRTNREALDRIRHALENWQSVTVELVNYRKDGTPFWMEMSLVPAGDRGDWYDHWIAIQRDITERRANEERLRLLESVVVHANDAVVISEAEPVDRPGPVVVYVNEAFTRMTGYEQSDILGKTPRILHGPGTDRAALDRIRANLEAWRPVNEVVRNYRKDGTEFWVNLSIVPVADETGWYTHWVSIQRDVTKIRLKHTLETDQREVLEAVARGVPLATALTMMLRLLERQLPGMTAAIQYVRDGRLQEACPSRLPEAYRRAAHGVEVTPTIGACGAAALRQQTIITADIAESPEWADSREFVLRHGLRACWSTPILSQNRSVLGTFAVYGSTPRAASASDIEVLEDAARLTSVVLERYNALSDMQHLALHDALTGLPNRTLFQQLLERATAGNTPGEKIAVGLLDLNRFKNINDTLGHAAGDELLTQLATRLRQCLRNDSVVARMSGDEFTFLLPAIRSYEDAVAIGTRILETFREPFTIAEREVFVQGSLGFSLYPDDATTTEELLSQADVAMYRAKRANRGWAFFRDIGRKPTDRALAIESGMYRALDRDEFTVYYQPVVRARTHQLVGFEALVRWQHPALGFISPGEFIPIAEDNGMIVPIGEWVLCEATRQAVEWSALAPELVVSVNLSARQFTHANLVTRVREALVEHGLAPSRLMLEITESVLIDAPDAPDTVQRLLDLGVRLAIDDFGTGYSSLAYLKRFPVHTIKLDRTFLEDILEDSDGINANLLRSVIGMGQSLRRQVVVEGVENAATVALCEAAGCDLLQGYHFARPLCASEATRLLESSRVAALLEAPTGD